MNILFRSLLAKIIFLTGMIVSIILILFSFINLHLLEKYSQKTIEDSAVLLAKGIDASIETKRRLYNPELLKREVDVIVESNRGVDAIHIFLFANQDQSNPESEVRFLIDSNTTRIFQVTREMQAILLKNHMYSQIKKEESDERFLTVVVPLHTYNVVIGGIAVRFRLSNLDSTLSRRRILFEFSTFATVALLVVALSWMMYSMVTRPVRQLVNGMGKVELGDLSWQIKSKRRDELGILTASFNHMVLELAETSAKNRQLLQEVELLNQNLQKRVEETTSELVLRNRELKEANERLIAMQRRLWDAERLATLGQVVANIAHEIGSPLGAVSGHIQLLKTDKTITPEQFKRLDLIDTQLNRVVSIIQQMLASVRSRSPVSKAVDVKSVTNDVLFLLSPMLSDKKYILQNRLPDGLPPILMNNDSLQQVFLNLLTNALDAMPDGGTLEITADIAPPEGGHGKKMMEISIRDSGEGITPEVQKHIYEPFFTTKPAGKGTGLGLALCKDIVARYDGKISFESQPGKGTSFHVFLPVES